MSESAPTRHSKRGSYLVIALIFLGVLAGVVAVLYWKYGVTVRKIEDGSPQTKEQGFNPHKAHARLCMGTGALLIPAHH